MTTSDVEERVEKIRAIRYDDEAAHSEEDELYADLLDAIALGIADEPQAMAKAALRTKKIEFSRWKS